MKTIIFFIFFIPFLFSCSSKNTKRENQNTVITSSTDCKYEDGTHSATVDYYNPETDYSATYTLDVEVQNCQVIQIDFSNGGYLDEDNISSSDIDENGHASVEGEDGKTYEIQIDWKMYDRISK